MELAMGVPSERQTPNGELPNAQYQKAYLEVGHDEKDIAYLLRAISSYGSI